MQYVLTLIGTSWDFLKKQPVILQAVFWLMFLPTVGTNVLSDYMDKTQQITNENVAPIALATLGSLVLTVIFIWGTACVILIGKRLLATGSGRSRTSFAAVRSEASTFIIPLVLTGILWGIFMCLLAIPAVLYTSILDSVTTDAFAEASFYGLLFAVNAILILPMIIYALNTIFSSIVVVLEGISYRAALRRSNAIVHRKKKPVFTTLFFLLITLFIPSWFALGFVSAFDPVENGLISQIAGAALGSLVQTLFILSLVQLYGSLLPATKPVTGGGKKSVAKKTATSKKK